jgi:hypothetical protein
MSIYEYNFTHTKINTQQFIDGIFFDYMVCRHKGFLKDCPDGLLTEAGFIKIYTQESERTSLCLSKSHLMVVDAGNGSCGMQSFPATMSQKQGSLPSNPSHSFWEQFIWWVSFRM